MIIDKVVEKYVSRARQLRILLVTSLEWMLVAAGVMVLSLTLPSILKELPGAAELKGTIASSVFMGMLVGALSSGFISDIFGRKVGNIMFLVLAGLFSGLTGASSDGTNFIINRFLAGVGYGGLLPVVNAYLTEFTAIKIRGLYLTLLEASWAIGSILLGVYTILTLGVFGWRASYYLLTLVSLPLLAVVSLLPESPKFAYMRGGRRALEKALGTKIDEKVEMHKIKKVPFLEILSKRFAPRTLMVWFSWFTVSFIYYGLFIWAPKIFRSKGIAPGNALMYTFFMLMMQLPGYLLAAYLIERIGRKKSIMFFFSGTAVSALLLAAVNSQGMLLFSSVVMSVFCLGAWGMVYAYTPELYPTEMRGLGNGSAGVMARIAGIIAPYYTAFMMDKTGSITWVMIPMSLLAITTVILNATFGIETRGKPVE
ncbi:MULTISPECIES: MFS transporter [Kosmotoga]|uniref:Major facilitator superfamily MFS_1 n=1 Tax=Kosmotoga olearia (strain ATCC BAA-1733 / DSM 21960 / TBF 19.5.1) TaxID=521045 RepID=C5CHD3_KOSOT|nr:MULTISPECIES: MFS transporter [Kosmotoga]ACR78772.1 major facilitator superfamily MFS_1 [Kosmotoga olearia TBF 19.5.1]MDI3524130.1 transporter, putative metabolite:H+ symporter [Kosmotoga sp.]MDK2952625.1 transporter, putative metabolite:H+ symporter [Kosmotoga sp.]OAA23047.1 MFS transporter [Kosmotoga sp. DU53]